MSLAARVSPHLPFLRRYARALTGSRREGDERVQAVLESLALGTASLNDGLPTRAALYRLFHTLRTSKETSSDPVSGRAETPDQRLQQLPPRSRQALLLNALESFSFRDIGAILDVSAVEAERLAADAQAEIEKELATSILIIEDEAMIALDVKEIVEELGHRVTGIARTHAEAVRLAHRDPPGLVLADIQLADASSGVDAAREILADFDAPVIFVTAYPERLLTGDAAEPTYLLTKPFERGGLKAAIGQALFFHQPRARAI